MSKEIIDRLNELLECERAGVEAALGLATSTAPGFTHGELRAPVNDSPFLRLSASLLGR